VLPFLRGGLNASNGERGKHCRKAVAKRLGRNRRFVGRLPVYCLLFLLLQAFGCAAAQVRQGLVGAGRLKRRFAVFKRPAVVE